MTAVAAVASPSPVLSSDESEPALAELISQNRAPVEAAPAEAAPASAASEPAPSDAHVQLASSGVPAEPASVASPGESAVCLCKI